MAGKAQRHQIYEIVMDAIKTDIAEGKLKAGDRIETVRELAQSLGVGQSSVREAVRVLSYMGLLRVKHGDEIYVTDQLQSINIMNTDKELPEYTRTSLRQLLELRVAIEPVAARLAAERATEKEGQEILMMCNRVQKVHEERLKDFQEEAYLQEEDVTFHLLIARASHNPLIFEALENVHPQLLASRSITSQVPQLVDSALRFHPQITRSILSHDPLRAENFMRTHIEDIMWWLDVHDNKGQAIAENELILSTPSIGTLDISGENSLSPSISLDMLLD